MPIGSFPSTDILRLEELSLNAYPALQTLHHAGWLLRFAEGETRRINSVQPLYGGDVETGELDARIDLCEYHYQHRGLRVVFKLTPASPRGLEDRLAARGYARNSDSSVQRADLMPNVQPDIDPADRIEMAEVPDSAWLDTYCEWGNHDRAVIGRVFANLLPRAGFLRLSHEGAPIAIGYGVVEAGWLGLYGIAVRADRRGLGIGGQITRRLMAWGAQQDAAQAYLQVLIDNPPAQALYARLGFTEAYRYWYRQRA